MREDTPEIDCAYEGDASQQARDVERIESEKTAFEKFDRRRETCTVDNRPQVRLREKVPREHKKHCDAPTTEVVEAPCLASDVNTRE
jgi:hypothetical protein